MRVQLLRPANAVADTAAPLLERESSLALLNEYAAQAAGDPLRVTLGDLASQRCTWRVGLMPLSPDAVRRLAGGSGLPASKLYRLTGGNPFYVTEVLRAGMEEVAPSARDAVLARAAWLSRDAHEVLDVAALTGARVEARLLESVTGCSSTGRARRTGRRARRYVLAAPFWRTGQAALPARSVAVSRSVAPVAGG